MNINFNNFKHLPKFRVTLPPPKFRASALFTMQWQWARQGQKIIGALANQRQRKAIRTTRLKLMKKNFYLLDETAVEELCKRLIDAEIRETLCLAQEFAPNSKPLAEALYKFQLAGLTDEEMAARFDQRDFEDANLLLWINGHGGDVLIYPKSHDAIGHEILGINQIAGSLAFLERPALSQSHPFRGGLAELSILSGAAERPPLGEEESPPFQGGVLQNPLRCLPNANQPLSFEGKTKIRALSIEALSEKLARFGLESSVDAFRERLALLKELANQPGITIRQIDTQMAKITRFG